VLRRVTPEVIRDVLAEPCGLGAVDTAEARALFEGLRREVSLVEPVGPAMVRQRPDIRRAMLPMMERDDPALLARVRGAALRYFRRQDTLPARTEELYYRLALGQATTTLDRAYDPYAARDLADDLAEFPPSSQVYLANRLGLTVAPELLTESDDLSWARQAALSARKLLDAGNPVEALAVVTARRGRTVRPFTAALEVEALAAQHRFAEALAAAAATLEWCGDHREAGTFVDVALLAARIAEDTGDFPEALRLLAEVDSVAGTAGDRIGRLTANTAALRIHRRGGTADSDEARILRDRVIREAGTLASRERSRHPGLVRDLAAEVGAEVPSIARDALRFGGSKAAPEPQPADGAPPPLTSVERGEQLSEIAGGGDDDLTREVTRELRSESDESAF
jgi:cellulose synthase operon protein C